MRNARRIREGRGLTLEEVAGRTSLKFSPLSRFERGEAWLGEAKMRELATFYGCTIDELIAETDVLPEPAGAPAQAVS